MAKKLINFLEEDLAISSKAIAFALRQESKAFPNLAMVLWQYGLITLEELDCIFNWMEARELEEL